MTVPLRHIFVSGCHAKQRWGGSYKYCRVYSCVYLRSPADLIHSSIYYYQYYYYYYLLLYIFRLHVCQNDSNLSCFAVIRFIISIYNHSFVRLSSSVWLKLYNKSITSFHINLLKKLQTANNEFFSALFMRPLHYVRLPL